MPPPRPRNILSISASYFFDCVRKQLRQGNYHICGADVGVDGIEVLGHVALSNLDELGLNKELLIEHVNFRDAVSINNCSFNDGVKFQSCKFDHSVDLGKAVLHNGLEFISCSIGVAGIALDRAALVLDDAKIDGDLVFFDATVSGCVLARRLKLSGYATFTACTVEGDSTSRSAVLDLAGSSVKGGIVFENGRRPASARQSITEAAADRARSLFTDRRDDSGTPTSVSLRAAQVGQINIGWARFEGRVDFADVKCRELFSTPDEIVCREDEPMRSSDKDADEGFGGAVINGSLQLWRGDFGLIRFSGIFIAGEMTLIDGRSGQIVVEDAIYGGFGSEQIRVVPSRIGNFFMSRWHCREFLRLHASEVSSEPDSSRIRGITIKASRVDRGISLWPGSNVARLLQQYLAAVPPTTPAPTFSALVADASSVKLASQADCRTLLNRWQRSMSVCGEVNIDQCVIGDHLELTNIRLANQKVMVANSTIKGTVTFRSPVSYLAGHHATEPILHLLAKFIARADIMAKGARCCALDMHGSRTDEVDLTGLRIRKMRKEKGIHNGVNLADVKVAGKITAFARLRAAEPEKSSNAKKTPKAVPLMTGHDLQFDPGPPPIDWEQELLKTCFDEKAIAAASAAPLPAHPKREAAAHIPGTLDVQHSEIGELVISDRSFRVRTQASKASATGIVLDYASINKLYVARPHQSSVTHSHNGFPVPLSLLDLVVKTWFLEEEGGVHVDRETTSADLYLDLLDNDPVFRMSSYLTIQSSLRDRGRSEEARRIFIAGIYRDRRTDSRSIRNGAEPQPERDKRPSRRWKQWRPGDGRYRGSGFAGVLDFLRSHLSDVLVMLSFPALILAGVVLAALPFSVWEVGSRAIDLAGEHMWCVVISLLVAGFAGFSLWGKIFRLRRPALEYVGFVLCLLWWVLVVPTVYFLNQALTQGNPANLEYLVCFLGMIAFLWFVLQYFLRSAMICFFDQLYWSLVDYGTSALRLPAVIFVLMFVSFVLVSGERENFEPTLLAELKEAQAAHAEGREVRSLRSKWAEEKVPTKESWVFGERMWMTVRYHVPLVGAVISEEWQPADRSLVLAGMETPDKPPQRPSWWPFAHFYWARARDWYAAMLWLNWILWPLFLPFLIRVLARER